MEEALVDGKLIDAGLLATCATHKRKVYHHLFHFLDTACYPPLSLLLWPPLNPLPSAPTSPSLAHSAIASPCPCCPAHSNVLPAEVDLQRDFFTGGSASAMRAVFASWALDECRSW